MIQPSRAVVLALSVGAIVFGSVTPASAVSLAAGEVTAGGIAGAAGVAASAHSAASPAVSVSLTLANAGDLDVSEPLRASIAIDNPTSSSTAAATATLTITPTPFSTRTTLADWFSGKTKASAASKTVGDAPVPSVLSQSSAGVAVNVDFATLGIATPGVYGVSVQVASNGTVIGTSRSALALDATSAATVPVAIAVPLTVPAGESEFLTAAQLTQYTAPDGILTKELADVQGTDIAVGIDPRIIASIRVLGKSAPSTALAWLDELSQLTNETFPLAWADADLTAPLHAGSTAVLAPKSLTYSIDPSQFPATTNSTPTPTPTAGGSTSPVPTSAQLVSWKYTMPALEWPAANSVEPSDLSKLAAAGISSAIVSTANVDGQGSTGLAGASARSGSMTLAVSDDVLSSYFQAAAESANHTASERPMTELAATLAMIGLQSGASPRPVLLTLDRNWAGSDTTFSRSVSDLYNRTWVAPAELSSVFTATPSAVTLDKDTESPQRIELVAAMMAAEARVVRFAPIAKVPAAITSSYRLQLLSMLSNEWLDTPAQWVTAANAYIAQSNKVASSVQLSRSSTLLLLSDQTALPISITNGLDQDVTVTLTVRPSTPQVSIDRKDRSQTVIVSANSQKRVEIPLQALSNGKATIVVTLASATGLPIGTAVTLNVNVQAGWETLGTGIFVALVVALFAFGVVRNVRKRRREAAEGE